MVLKNLKGLVSYLGIVVLSLVLVFISSQIFYKSGYNFNNNIIKFIFIFIIGIVTIIFGINLGAYENLLENLLSFIFSFILIVVIYMLYRVGLKITSLNLLVLIGQILLSPMLFILKTLNYEVTFINLIIVFLAIGLIYGLSGVIFNKKYIKKKYIRTRKLN